MCENALLSAGHAATLLVWLHYVPPAATRSFRTCGGVGRECGTLLPASIAGYGPHLEQGSQELLSETALTRNHTGVRVASSKAIDSPDHPEDGTEEQQHQRHHDAEDLALDRQWHAASVFLVVKGGWEIMSVGHNVLPQQTLHAFLIRPNGSCQQDEYEFEFVGPSKASTSQLSRMSRLLEKLIWMLPICSLCPQQEPPRLERLGKVQELL